MNYIGMDLEFSPMRLPTYCVTALLTITGAAGADYVENFGGAPTSGYLAGAVEPRKDGVWTVRVIDGLARLANSTENSAVRFYDVPSIEVNGTRQGTDGAQISASVRVDDAPDGAAGVLIGYPHGGDYYAFLVGDGNRFKVLEKRDGRLQVVDFGTSEAINDGAFNYLSVDRGQGSMVKFAINGKILHSVRISSDMQMAPVGIAVAGRGQFDFDMVSVDISDEQNKAKGSIIEIGQPGLEQTPVNACDLPRARTDDIVALVGVYEGEAISTLTIAGQDSVTSTLELEIEEGDKPLYIVAGAFDPVIWRLSGATHRVRHFAGIGGTAGGGEAVAVTGIDEDRVSFHHQRDCFKYAYDPLSGDFLMNADRVASLVDMYPQALIGHYGANSIRVPSGLKSEETTFATPLNWNEKLARSALRFSPGGLVSFDPDTVVSALSPELYQVLPQEFGLLQLEADGAIEMNDDSGSSFIVTNDMPRYPAGLTGAHSVTFYLEPDVADPTGDPGHSKVFRFEHPRPTAQYGLSPQ